MVVETHNRLMYRQHVISFNPPLAGMVVETQTLANYDLLAAFNPPLAGMVVETSYY